MERKWPVLSKVASLCCIGVLTYIFCVGRFPAGMAGNALVRAETGSSPSVNDVSPNLAPNDLDSPIVITGTGFASGLSASLSIQLSSGSLKIIPLTDIELKHSTELKATVPWGLDPGVYTITVTNPDDQSGILADAFTVTQGIGVWTSDGPYGGSVITLLVNPASTNTIYAALQSYASGTGIGLFRSLDSGASWEIVLADIANQAHAADLSASSPPSIYAYQWGKGLARSDDGGDNWTILPVPNPSCIDTRLFASPVEPETIYITVDCGTSGGIYKSADRGASWTPKTGGLLDLHVTALATDPVDPQVMVSATSSGEVFRSTNGGENWLSIGKPDDFISDLAFNPFGEHEPWAAGADSSGHWGYLWKYLNDTWVKIMPGTGAENQVSSILFSPETSETMWIGTLQGSFKSTNGGDTWASVGSPAHHVNALAADPTDQQVIFLGYNGLGIYRTADGGANWDEVNHGLAGVYPNGLAIHPNAPAVVYATAHGVGTFKTNNGGGSWFKLPLANLIPSAPLVDPFNPLRVYVGAGNGLEISADEGSTWHKVMPSLPPAFPSNWSVQVISLLYLEQPGHLLMGVGFSDNNATSYGFVGGGIYTSTDYAESWNYVDMGQTSDPVAVLTSDPNHPATIFAGTGSCCEGEGNGVWKSVDSGATWSPSGLSGLQITGIAVDPVKSRQVYASNRNLFYFSADGGDTWTLRMTQDSGMDKILVVPAAVTTIYQYGWGGIVRTIDGGLHWERAAGSLGFSETNTISASTLDGRVVMYVGSGGGPVTEAGQGVQESAVTNTALLNAGVYRKTVRDLDMNIYLPVIQR